MRPATKARLRARAPAMGGNVESAPGAAAAAVVSALRGDSLDKVRAAVEAAAGDAAICRWVAETDIGQIGPGRGEGRDGLWYACRIASQELATFGSLAEALVWTLGGPND